MTFAPHVLAMFGWALFVLALVLHFGVVPWLVWRVHRWWILRKAFVDLEAIQKMPAGPVRDAAWDRYIEWMEKTAEKVLRSAGE